MNTDSTTLGALLDKIATKLTERLDSDEATAADFGNAIRLLRDNSITCAPSGENAIGVLQDKLKERANRRAKITPGKVDFDEALASLPFQH